VILPQSPQLCQNGGLHFYLQSGKQTRGWLGEDSRVIFFIKNDPGEKESEMVPCHYTTATSFVAKFRGEVFAHFHTVTVKRHTVRGIDCLARQGLILCEQCPQVKENQLSSVSPFSELVSLDTPFNHPRTAQASYAERLPKHRQGIHHTLFQICTKSDAHTVGSVAKSHQVRYTTPNKGM
jgi:hypothetical protein